MSEQATGGSGRSVDMEGAEPLTPSTQRIVRGTSGRVQVLEDVLVGFVNAHRGLLGELAGVENQCGEFLADPELKDEGRRLLRSCFRIRARAQDRLERMLARMEEINSEAERLRPGAPAQLSGESGWARRTREEFEKNLESAERHRQATNAEILEALHQRPVEAEAAPPREPKEKSFLQSLAEAKGPDGKPLVERVSPAGQAGPQRAKEEGPDGT